MLTTPPKSLDEIVKKETLGESILWAGVPEKWAYAKRHWITALFSIPFTGMAVFFVHKATTEPGSIKGADAAYFPWVSMLFVATGVGMLLTPFLSAFVSQFVYYVITNKRAIIFKRFPLLTVQSFNGKSLKSYERVSHGGAIGNLIFKRMVSESSDNTTVKEIGFFGVKDYINAERALDRMIAQTEAT